MGRISFNKTEATKIGELIGVDWSEIDKDEFLLGMNHELQYCTCWEGTTDISKDDEILTAKLAQDRLIEIPDYYSRLKSMEKEARKYWKGRNRKIETSSKGQVKDFEASMKDHFDRMRQ